MISVEEAKSILIKNTFKSEKMCNKDLFCSEGHFLGEDIYAAEDLPPFNQSNVDGIAIKFSDAKQWKIKGEIKAGDNPKLSLSKSEAVRIFTGAVVPKTADCIIMQENLFLEKNKAVLKDNYIFSKGNFIRPKGSQIKKGELAVPQNTFISPAVAGFLAALGTKKVKVICKPRIYLIVTGNELQTPGKKLSFGKVYDSNSFIISSALRQMSLEITKTIFVKDVKDKLINVLSECVRKADVVLISGGVSVGKYDFVNEALDKIGVTRLFYKVAQRPGKPLYFGKKNKTYVFGLPGNPASVFTCFYEYVYPALRKLQGFENLFLTSLKLPSVKKMEKSFKLGNFLKAKITGDRVESLEGQASYILKTFTDANCFIYLPLNKRIVKEGEIVEVHLFPY